MHPHSSDVAYELQPIHQPDLADRVHAILKEQILRQNLGSGSQVFVDDIAKSLNVSRTPVQEALHRLAIEDLVVVKPRRGTFVKPLAIEEFLESSELRENLELFAARLAIERATERQIALLRELMDGFTPYHTPEGKRTDIAGFSRKNAEFHDLHIQMAGNGKLLRVYRSLNIDVIQSRIYFRREARSALEVRAEHEAIIQGYEERNLDAVCRAVSLHCQRGRTGMLAILEEMGGAL